MNKSLFKISFIFFFLLLGTYKSFGQKLKFLIPDASIAQYAGSIGYLSIGAGYEIFKNKGYLDFNYGYVPASKGGKLHTATIKFAYKPFEIKLNDRAKLYPINPGLFLSYTFQEYRAFKFRTSEYPRGYYYWTPALRPHLSVSNEIEFSLPDTWAGTGIDKIGLYTEFNTNDFYIVNFFQNGVRLKF